MAAEINETGLGTHHNLELILAGNRWLIFSDDYIDPFREWLESGHATPRRGQPSVPTDRGTASPASRDGTVHTMSTVSYSPGNAAAYADTYCGSATGCGNTHQYNTGTYSTETDDCTNFVSQVENAGGAPQDSTRVYSSDWYYDYPSKSGSVAWVRASSHVWYLYNNPGGHTYDHGYLVAQGSYSTVSQYLAYMWRGDVVGYNFGSGLNHTAIAAAYDSNGNIQVDAHNSDKYHAPWDLGYSTFATYTFVSMNWTINTR